MSNKLRFLAAFAAFSVSMSACNVDRVWPDGQRVDGPEVGDPHRPLGQPRVGADIAVAKQQEVDLVEAALAARADYQAKLAELRDYYLAEGYPNKASWADYELSSAKNIKQFRYVIDSEVPSGSLSAQRQIPEADKLYDGGLALMRKGAAGPFYRQKVMVEAAQTFKRLIELYPESDKIDDAAFQLGEIHKEYLPDQESLAVKWYERAWTWDPQTPHPARYNAAVVCDYRLNDRDRALELYHQVLRSESQVSLLNRRFASRRIEALSRGGRTVADGVN